MHRRWKFLFFASFVARVCFSFSLLHFFLFFCFLFYSLHVYLLVYTFSPKLPNAPFSFIHAALDCHSQARAYTNKLYPAYWLTLVCLRFDSNLPMDFISPRQEHLAGPEMNTKALASSQHSPAQHAKMSERSRPLMCRFFFFNFPLRACSAGT